jgi:large subunit ribosomal protein L10
MPLTPKEKEAIVAGYREGMATAPHAFLVDFQGVNVPEVTELRSRIRETGARYEVVKNTLALRALEGKPLEQVRDSFQGPIAVAYCQEDPVGLAKVLTEFAKTVPAVEFRGGIIDGQPVAAEDIQEIAKLPGREELLAKLVFLLESPVTRLVRGLAAIPRQLVVVLDQIGRQREGA